MRTTFSLLLPAASELLFTHATGNVIATIPVTHVNQSGGETLLMLASPVTAKLVKWHVTKLGPQNYGTVGGAEIAATASGPTPVASRLSLEPFSVIPTAFKSSDDSKALIVRLLNPTDQPQMARLNWSKPASVTWLSSAREEQGLKAPDSIPLVKQAMVTLRVEP